MRVETPPSHRPTPLVLESPASSLDADALERALSEAWSHATHHEGAEPPAPSGAQPHAPVARPAAPPPAKPRPRREAASADEYLRLCAGLLEKGQADEAARRARDGLLDHPAESRLLLELSRAEACAGRPEAALRAAFAAHRAKPSRTTLKHLLRLATAARSFHREDGDRLRRAVERHRDEPVLLHAAGVFEALHGDPWAAIGLLRTALRFESEADIRAAIVRELARLESPAPGDRAA